MPPEAALTLMTGPLTPPAEAAQRPLWFFIACRRIDSWIAIVELASRL